MVWQRAEGRCAQVARRQATQEGLPAVVTAQPRQRGWHLARARARLRRGSPSQDVHALLRPGFNGLLTGAAPAEDD